MTHFLLIDELLMKMLISLELTDRPEYDCNLQKTGKACATIDSLNDLMSVCSLLETHMFGVSNGTVDSLVKDIIEY